MKAFAMVAAVASLAFAGCAVDRMMRATDMPDRSAANSGTGFQPVNDKEEIQ